MQKKKIVIQNPVSFLFGMSSDGPLVEGRVYELTNAQIAMVMDTAKVFTVDEDGNKTQILSKDDLLTHQEDVLRLSSLVYQQKSTTQPEAEAEVVAQFVDTTEEPVLEIRLTPEQAKAIINKKLFNIFDSEFFTAFVGTVDLRESGVEGVDATLLITAVEDQMLEEVNDTQIIEAFDNLADVEGIKISSLMVNGETVDISNDIRSELIALLGADAILSEITDVIILTVNDNNGNSYTYSVEFVPAVPVEGERVDQQEEGSVETDIADPDLV